MFGSNILSFFSESTTTFKTAKAMAKDQKQLIEQQRPKPIMKSKAKKRVSFDDAKPSVFGEENSCGLKNGNQRDQLKVKILMTKEEAARLLAKCKDGGRLEFKDVARELVQIPINRVNLVSSSRDQKEL